MPEAPANSFEAKTRAALRKWLSKNHTRTEGTWLITYKKASGKARVSYDDIVEECLCFGWVDSKTGLLDAERSMLWIAPRRPGSAWAKTNKARVERLIAEGLMRPAGLAKVEAAKKDGTWSALDEVEQLITPPDLQAALGEYPNAKKYFDAFPKSIKRGILEWIMQAKRAETRAKRVAETAAKANENIRANQWRQ